MTPELMKKIFAISLTQKKKFKAYAVYNGEQLVFQIIQQIKGLFSDWKDALKEEIETRKKRGFIVLVEERTEHISQHGTQFSFEDVDTETGRVNYYEALDWYFALENMGNLILPAESQHYAIRANRIDIQQDEKGRVKYNINWDSFTGAQRAMLLCCMAALGANPVSSVYLDQYFGGLDGGKPEEEANPYKSFRAITHGFDRKRGLELDEIRKQAFINKGKQQ